MLMHARELCVVHVADLDDGQALQLLCHTTPVIANLGVNQVVVALTPSRGADLPWTTAQRAEVRLLRSSGFSVFGKIRALQAEITKLSSESSLHAVHLHGVAPCLLGSQALKASPLRGRVLYSPHLSSSASPWTTLLLGRLLQTQLQALQYAVTASLGEAHTLSRLLNRSAEVLPYPVSDVFFESARQEGVWPSVLAGGSGVEAVDGVTRLSVLLNGRDARVPIAWLGAADSWAGAQLEAASVQVRGIPSEAERALALSRASAFIHMADDSGVPLVVAQAMAAGVPCLVSDTPSHRALIRHGETGFVCTSEWDFVEKLILLLRNREERHRIGEAARAEAERRFTLRHFERAILRAYGFSGGTAVSNVD
jgi:hypothetical protein